jgi:tryptophan synthase beta subunit
VLYLKIKIQSITRKEGRENPDYLIACVGGGVMQPVLITII